MQSQPNVRRIAAEYARQHQYASLRDTLAHVRETLGHRLPTGVPATVEAAYITVRARQARNRASVRTLRERLQSHVEADMADVLRTAGYRRASSSWAGGDTNYQGHLVSGGATEITTITSRQWSSNRKWAGNDLSICLHASASWLLSMRRDSLAVIDGLVTLSAAPTESPEGYRAWVATWGVQSRGFDVRPQSGMIVRHVPTGLTVHGATVRGAIRTITQRLANPPAVTDIPADVVVTLADADAAGMCQTGVSDWRNRHCPGMLEISARDLMLIAARCGDRVPLVARTIAAAIRRHHQTSNA